MTTINGILILLTIWIIFLIYLTMTDQRVHYHDQNLTDGKGTMWRHGRAWWYITPRDENKWRHGPGVHLEWSVSRHSHFDIDITVLGDDGDDIQLHLGIPWLISLYFTLERLPLFDRIPYKWRRTYGYQTSLAFYGGTLWVKVFHTDMWGSGPIMRWLPRWISIWKSVGYKDEWRGVGFYISFNFDRLILGSYERTERNIGEPIIREIPIEPDNRLGLHYFATFQKQEEVRWRGNFPWRKKRALYWEISTDHPPLHAGKGENSWDQDDDGIMGCSVTAETVEDAVVRYQEKCQRDRKKYGLPDVIYQLQRRS